ncbi:translation initiation inhibitor [Candidatus Caldarchaeum subterraneum]|uniref:Translation initiation inhibitor n=2 Tax=Thermoproteati TaxID=1783275 RepID=H5SNQ8_9CREN|nr:translation initiation inhibitor [Candidatus Caldarchaeum subterraneum]BAJ51220.1 translation initiation inhibitor [Candidatus Caldarchaeum subterraneum]BAL57794.1 translation initiation inhibitor [uncultured crenarchaeote]
MRKEIIFTEKAPKPIGPYSQAVRVGDFLFLSGMVAINPATGKVEETDIRSQTRRVMENAKAILEAAGLSFEHVVKATVYLANPDDFAAMNEVYSQYFPQNPPARTTVAVHFPRKEFLVEIDFIAYMGR